LTDELLPRAVEFVEKRIAEQEAERNALEGALADPDLYTRPNEFQTTMTKFNEAEAALAESYEMWEKLAARMDTVESE
ncbi:MAG: ABC transporter C-terminal domain-containing protein, partial [Rubricoccaceae bacterium]|nr:ABC transporter C-terminal domain-containing protein [Rubricoccaceae bacterium]